MVRKRLKFKNNNKDTIREEIGAEQSAPRNNI